MNKIDKIRKNKVSKDILQGGIRKTLLRLAFPTMIAFAFHMGFNFVDRFFVSKLGPLAFGALGMAFIVQSIIIALGTGVGIGAASLIARLIGQKKLEDANRAALHAMLVVIVISLVFTASGLLGGRAFFKLLGASDEMLPYILEYVNIIFIASGFIFFTMTVNSIFRGEGNMITPMVGMIIGVLVNFILDPLFIFGLGPFPALGIEGAALATLIGRMVSAVVLGAALFKGKNLIKPNIKLFRFKKYFIGRIFDVGGPTIVSRLCNSIGISMIFILLKIFGDNAKAAFTIGITYQMVAFLPIIGIGQATVIMVGQNYGAKNYERVKRIVSKAVLMTFLMVSIISLVYTIGREPFTRLFSQSDDTLYSLSSIFYNHALNYTTLFSNIDNFLFIEIGKNLLQILSLSFPFVGMQYIYVSLLQGQGKGMESLLLNICLVIFQLVAAWLISIFAGLNGIWLGVALGSMLASGVGFLFVRSTNAKLS